MALLTCSGQHRQCDQSQLEGQHDDCLPAPSFLCPGCLAASLHITRMEVEQRQGFFLTENSAARPLVHSRPAERVQEASTPYAGRL